MNTTKNISRIWRIVLDAIIAENVIIGQPSVHTRDKTKISSQTNRETYLIVNKRSQVTNVVKLVLLPMSNLIHVKEIHMKEISCDSDRDSYAFMTVNKWSQALNVNLDKHAWYADLVRLNIWLNTVIGFLLSKTYHMGHGLLLWRMTEISRSEE